MRKQEIKVFSGRPMVNRKQVNTVVAATSKAAAVEALQAVGIKVGLSNLAKYWTQSANEVDLAVALAQPGTVFAASSDKTRDYQALPFLDSPLPKVKMDVRERRESSDKAKAERGERRVTTWLPKEAAEALDRITGENAERGAVQSALTAALLAYSPPPDSAARKRSARG